MKKKAVFIAVLALAACNKEMPNPQQPIPSLQLMQIDQLDFELIENPHDVMEYILNPEDLDDQKIQTNLHNIGLLARDLFKSNFYNQLIIEEALNHDNLSIKLSKFLEDVQAQNENHQSILSAVQTEIAGMDFTRTYTSPETGQVLESYIPAIFVVNAETANPDYAPIVSAGVFVNPDFPESEMYDDYGVAWIYDDVTAVWKEILISEEVAMTTKHPIFVFDNAEVAISNRPRTVYSDGGTGKTASPMKRLFAINDIMIDERYENGLNAKSDFAVSATLIDENGGAHRTLYKKGLNQIELKLLKINKSDMGVMFYNQWKSITQIENQTIDLEPFNQNYLFWNTFEHDWLKGHKDLGKGTANGATVTLSGKRKYSGDWYTYDANSTALPALDFNYIWGAWSKAHVNTKSDVRVWRYRGI